MSIKRAGGMRVWGVVVGAGEGKRFGRRKPLVEVAGQPLVWHALTALLAHPAVKGLTWVVHPDDWDRSHALAKKISKKPVLLVTGGTRRQDSVQSGIAMVPQKVEWVAIHDAARPLVTSAQLTAVFAAAQKSGAAILALPVSQTAKRENGRGGVLKTVPRNGLWLAHTPQVFKRSLLLQAFAKNGGRDVTDDAMLIERFKRPVALVPSHPWNIKVTTPEDVPVVEALLKVGGKSGKRGRRGKSGGRGRRKFRG